MIQKRIKEIREVLRSQEDLATILIVTKNTVWRYKNGRGLPGEDVTVGLFSLESSLKDTSERRALKEYFIKSHNCVAIQNMVKGR